MPQLWKVDAELRIPRLWKVPSFFPGAAVRLNAIPQLWKNVKQGPPSLLLRGGRAGGGGKWRAKHRGQMGCTTDPEGLGREIGRCDSHRGKPKAAGRASPRRAQASAAPPGRPPATRPQPRPLPDRRDPPATAASSSEGRPCPRILVPLPRVTAPGIHLLNGMRLAARV